MGDIVSVIDMPPKVLSTWWRGKHGFQVGNRELGVEKFKKTVFLDSSVIFWFSAYTGNGLYHQKFNAVMEKCR